MNPSWMTTLDHLGRRVERLPGCTDAELSRAEAALGVTMPRDLADMLRVTNGFLDVDGHYTCAWDLDTVAKKNQRAWNDPKAPLDRDLIAFGEDGAGGWFCLALPGLGAAPVLHWGWIDLDRREVAATLDEFWRAWFAGTITI